jgi:hypothetical protein
MYVYLNIISVKMLRRFVLGEAILERSFLTIRMKCIQHAVLQPLGKRVKS